MDEYVALTDASHTRSGRGGSRRYHWPHPDDTAVTACGRWLMCDDHHGTGTDEAPGDVDVGMRCGLNGCRQRWAEFASRAD